MSRAPHAQIVQPQPTRAAVVESLDVLPPPPPSLQRAQSEPHLPSLSAGVGGKRRLNGSQRARKRRTAFINAMEGRQKGGCGPQLSFLEKLVKMLEEEDADIVTWTPDGDAFVICDQQRFAQEVLPKYFRSAKWNSFQRQLNLYNFYVHNKSFDRLVYANPLFHRGRMDLIRLIKRSPVKRKADGSAPASGAGSMSATPPPPGMLPRQSSVSSLAEASEVASSASTESSEGAAMDDHEDHGYGVHAAYHHRGMAHAHGHPAHLQQSIPLRRVKSEIQRPHSTPAGMDSFGDEDAVTALLGLLGRKVPTNVCDWKQRMEIAANDPINIRRATPPPTFDYSNAEEGHDRLDHLDLATA